MNVLIVEDEVKMAEEMAAFLTREHFLCEIATIGVEASEKIAVNLYDFVLLDLGLPDYNGLDLLKEGKMLDTPPAFIIITARGAVEEKVKGLNIGADDYLAKPFSLVELNARIQAVARRKFKIESSDIQIGEFLVKTDNRIVKHKEKTVELTRKEFDLLLYLLLNKEKTLTRVQLYEHIWGNLFDDQYDSNFIDVHIKNLRKKLSPHAPVDWIKTTRGVGYKISEEE